MTTVAMADNSPNAAPACQCGWYQDDEPREEIVTIHDAVVAIEEPGGLLRMAEACNLVGWAVDVCEFEPLQGLAGRHNFTDPAGVYEFAIMLDSLLRAA